MRTLEQRFHGKYEPEPMTGCWLWTGAAGPRGYGNIRSQAPESRTVLAHRVAWELSNGPVSDGLCVCHRCDTPACVNPDHLFLGTAEENNRDRDRKGRHRTDGRENKTHCKHGHSFDSTNTYVWVGANGRRFRQCRACHRRNHSVVKEG